MNKLQILSLTDKESVITLYKNALGTPGCVWDEHYPSEELLLEDIAKQDLFGIKDEQGRVIAAIAKDRDPEVDQLNCWTENWKPAAELARLVVANDYKNQGLAKELIIQVMPFLRERGFKAVHYLVAINNEPAMRAYKALQFAKVGETDMFGHHYDCYEKQL